MSGEVEIGAFAVCFCTQQRVQHANDFTAFFVHGDGVEIINRLVFVRANRVRHWASVLCELARLHEGSFFDAHHGGRVTICGILLFAEDGKAFFQRQLKPVAAGDAVAAPVVKILVRNNGVDHLKIGVSRRVFIGEQVARVENIQPLVFHRAHVEVIGCVDHEAVEVVFTSVRFFVPTHRGFQTLHCPGATWQIGRRRIDFEQYFAARCGDEVILQRIDFARDQRE